MERNIRPVSKSLIQTLPYKEEGCRVQGRGLVRGNFTPVQKFVFLCCELQADARELSKGSKHSPKLDRLTGSSTARDRGGRTHNLYSFQCGRVKEPSNGRGRFGHGLRWAAGRHQRQACAGLSLGETAKEGEAPRVQRRVVGTHF